MNGRCDRTGCGGELDATGYCRVCLMPPIGTSASRAESGPAPRPRPTPETPQESRGTSAPSQNARTATTRSRSAASSRVADDDPWSGLNLVTPLEIDEPGPSEALQRDPHVPEEHRRCSQCGRPVGVGFDGQPSLLEGKCRHDGTRFSFVPQLQPGDLLADRYEIAGCLGHGGLGWVYLAYDRNLENRPVAVKGLIHEEDPDAVESAMEEKRFLIKLRHHDIVDIHDFVTHPPAGGAQRASHGYIVMQYVPGYALTSGRVPELPVEQILWYILRVLAVFHYLHEGGYLFCDLKPSNLMVFGSEVKLIDLGAVRETGTLGTGSYTADYAAPELATTGPTAATDLFTVGRTLEDLLSAYTSDIDEPSYASLRHLIARAIAREPGDRFSSAREMAGQLSGVLREIVVRGGGEARPAPSLLFSRAAGIIDNGLGVPPTLDRWVTVTARQAAIAGRCRPLDTLPPRPANAAAALPEPLADPADPAAGYLAGLVITDTAQAISQLSEYQDHTAGVDWQLCRLHLRLGQLAEAQAAHSRAARIEPGSWHRRWHEGLLALAAQRFAKARTAFEECRLGLPGELAPRLALALCAEYLAGGEPSLRAAANAYLEVWRISIWHESAAMGCARIHARLGDRAAAVEVLGQVPGTSPHVRAVRIAAVHVRAGSLGDAARPNLPGDADIAEARSQIAALRTQGLGDSDTARLLGVGVTEAELDLARVAGPRGSADDERALRLRLSGEYRDLAKQASDTMRRTVLVDLANAVRPLTLR